MSSSDFSLPPSPISVDISLRTEKPKGAWYDATSDSFQMKIPGREKPVKVTKLRGIELKGGKLLSTQQQDKIIEELLAQRPIVIKVLPKTFSGRCSIITDIVKQTVKVTAGNTVVTTMDIKDLLESRVKKKGATQTRIQRITNSANTVLPILKNLEKIQTSQPPIAKEITRTNGIPDKPITIQGLNGAENLVLPPAGLLLENWLRGNGDAIRAKEAAGLRIPYLPTRENIERAFTAFEERFQCDWHAMKKECFTPIERENMQIINDLRAAYLAPIFTQLQREFKGDLKRINDFGTDKLTSDKDFSFQVGKGQIAMEALIAHRFNQIFETIWGVPSARVFDSNAYTMQYVTPAIDPKHEATRAQLHQEGSLLMKLRTSSPASWKAFKDATLKSLEPSPAAQKVKIAEFEKIERTQALLQFKLNAEVIRLSGKSFPYDVSTPMGALQAAQEITALDRNIATRASNNLFVSYKTAMSVLEKQRIHIENGKKQLLPLCKVGQDPIQFAAAFNAHIQNMVSHLLHARGEHPDPKHLELIDSRILTLQNSFIAPASEKKAMDAFRVRIEHENRLTTLQTKRKNWDEIPHLLAKYDILKEKNKQYPTDILEREMEMVVRTLQKITKIPEQTCLLSEMGDKFYALSPALKREIEPHLTQLKSLQKLNAAYPKPEREREIERLSKLPFYIPATILSVKDIQEAYTPQIVTKRVGRLDKMIEKENGKLKTADFNWDRAGIFNVESDNLLIRIQQNNIIGNCFMQESHASEGATAVVIKNIQAGKSRLRTPNQYLQAFREISGYYSGHQEYEREPAAKLIESSKYAVRMMLVVDYLAQRAQALGIKEPLGISPESLKLLSFFFKELYALRGAGKTENEQNAIVAAAARKLGMNVPAKFTYEHVAQLNASMERMAAHLEAWCARIQYGDKTEADKLNAYFKTLPNGATGGSHGHIALKKKRA